MAQLHIRLDNNLMDKFKQLCKGYSIPVSSGIKSLIKDSLKKDRLPGMKSGLLTKSDFDQLMPYLNNLNNNDNQEKAITLINYIAKQIIPMSKHDDFLAVAAERYLQIRMLCLASDKPVLKHYLVKNGHRQKDCWPDDTNEFLFLVNQFITSLYFHETKVNGQNWFDISEKLVRHYPLLNKRCQYLGQSLINMISYDYMGVLRQITHWHVKRYLDKHTARHQLEGSPQISIVATKPKQIIKAAQKRANDQQNLD